MDFDMKSIKIKGSIEGKNSLRRTATSKLSTRDLLMKKISDTYKKGKQ